jgi:adenylate cyclase
VKRDNEAKGEMSGQSIRNDKQLYGAAINLAARLFAHAEPGPILASQVIRDLCIGKSFSFVDCDEFEAKGFKEAVSAFEIEWRNV